MTGWKTAEPTYRDWARYNDGLVVRGAKLADLMWLHTYESDLARMNRGSGLATDDDLRYAPGSGTELVEIGDGHDYERIVTQRANQSAFRRVVLRYAGNRCCLTGVEDQQLLIASHIKPWSECTPKEKTDVHNALCLNVLHDALFDRHLMTVDADLKAHYDPGLERAMGEDFFESSVARYERVRIGKHNRPDERYLEHHNRLFTEKTGVRI